MVKAMKRPKWKDLNGYLADAIKKFPDKRSGRNSTYSMHDIALSAFAVFYFQNPSFLQYQKSLLDKYKNNTAKTLFNVENTPTDNHIRDVLDQVSPDFLNSVYKKIFNTFKKTKELDRFRALNNQMLIAIDGTQFFTSKDIHCDHCSEKHHKDDEVTYSHSIVTPIVCKPGHNKVISLEPEFIFKQDGIEKQDCEINAAKRWMDKHGDFYSKQKTTLLGDDLYSREPFIKKTLELGFNFIFTCKKSSHKIMYEMMEFYEKLGDIKSFTIERRKNVRGKIRKEYDHYRYANNIRLNGEKNSLRFNWFEIKSVKENGKKIYYNTFITNHKITDENIVELVECGRARWKVENENNNTLKRQGYHLEHNFGHGKEHLANFFASLNILAFLFHTTQEVFDERYLKVREERGARYILFQRLKMATEIYPFKDWDQLMQFLLGEMQLQPIFDSS